MKSPSKRTIQSSGHSKFQASTPFRATNHKKAGNNSFQTQIKTQKGTIIPNPQQTIFVLPELQRIYAGLVYNNELESFPREDIMQAKKGIEGVLKLMIRNNIDNISNRCLKHPNQKLNLYCQKEKEMLCILCAHSTNAHQDKSHNIVPLEKVKRILDLDAERLVDKTKVMIQKLNEWQYRLDEKVKELSNAFRTIADCTGHLLDIMVEQIHRVKSEFSNILQRDYGRAQKIMDQYRSNIEELRNSFGKCLGESKILNSFDQVGLLKKIDGQMETAERLIKKSYEVINIVVPRWSDTQNKVNNMIDKKNSQSKDRREREIIITEF